MSLKNRKYFQEWKPMLTLMILITVIKWSKSSSSKLDKVSKALTVIPPVSYDVVLDEAFFRRWRLPRETYAAHRGFRGSKTRRRRRGLCEREKLKLLSLWAIFKPNFDLSRFSVRNLPQPPNGIAIKTVPNFLPAAHKKSLLEQFFLR